jgi:glycosyltransferase involved in cell wall biosynthesis
MKFSIIVPTYNEEQDIERTMKALERLDYPDYEVIIVDDGSKDHTPQIVDGFCARNSHFRLIRQERNRGVSAARNTGIRMAAGEVVVILNADVLLPEDFLTRIQCHYDAGAKWVAVWCNAINRDRFLARYTQLVGDYYHLIEKTHFVWTEGFSCTKEAAITVGLFPESMPGCSGEDVDFGLNLEKQFPGVKDTSIVVPHIAPDTIKGFWGQYKGRGRGRTNVYFYLRKLDKSILLLNTAAATVKRLLKLALVVPLWHAIFLSRYSEKGAPDILLLTFAGYFAETATLVGMWEALGRLFARENPR